MKASVPAEWLPVPGPQAVLAQLLHLAASVPLALLPELPPVDSVDSVPRALPLEPLQLLPVDSVLPLHLVDSVPVVWA